MDDLERDELRQIAKMTAVPGNNPLNQLAGVILFLLHVYSMKFLKELEAKAAKSVKNK